MSSNPPVPRNVVILGASGSIGEKAIAVARRYPDRIRVVGLAGRGSAEALARAAKQLDVRRLALADEGQVARLRAMVPGDVCVEGGPEAVAAMAGRDEVDLVVNGIVGRAGLEASLTAAGTGKTLALANKESLVLAGELLMETARRSGALVLPVDSEHSGLFQALAGQSSEQVRRLMITASGGPFRGMSRDQLTAVTPEDALHHPVWPMGPRITVDSATLFNKGLEVIETHHLFGVELERIGVWVHPQSAVHALVEMIDGSMIAQISAPDMMLPVQFAMSYPDRWDCDMPRCDLAAWRSLDFEDPDHDAFPALKLVYRAAEMGGIAPTALNAADEIAVDAFLGGRLSFLGIVPVLEEVLDRADVVPADTLDAIAAADREARIFAGEAVKAHAV